jgi:hypothetical protein
MDKQKIESRLSKIGENVRLFEVRRLSRDFHFSGYYALELSITLTLCGGNVMDKMRTEFIRCAKRL